MSVFWTSWHWNVSESTRRANRKDLELKVRKLQIEIVWNRLDKWRLLSAQMIRLHSKALYDSFESKLFIENLSTRSKAPT